MSAQDLPKKSLIRLLALGDSYTIGESVAEDQRWPMQLARALHERGYRNAALELIARTGWRTDQLRDAIIARELSRDFDCATLQIGVNNQYQHRSIAEYHKDFEELVRMGIDLASGQTSKVIVLSIPDYGFTPFGKERQVEISSEIDAFNAVNRKIAEQHDVHYVDITDISRRGLADPELIAEDGLHPSPVMYGLWVKRVLPIALSILSLSKR